jgi:exopolysaccharide biosynthesis polyprenyl glycosylphosphotransferase
MRFVFRSLGTAAAFIESGGVYSLDGELVGYVDNRQNVYDLVGHFKGLLLRDGRIATDPTAEPPAQLKALPEIQRQIGRPTAVPQMLAMEPLPPPYIESFVVAPQESDRQVAFPSVPLLVSVTAFGLILLATYLISVNPTLTTGLPGITKRFLAVVLSLAALIGIAAGFSLRRSRRLRPPRVLIVGTVEIVQKTAYELEHSTSPIAKVVDRVDTAPSGSPTAVRLAALLKAGRIDQILFHDSLRGQMSDLRTYLGDAAIDRVNLLSSFIETSSLRVPLDLVDDRILQALSASAPQVSWARAIKRLGDILVATLLLLFQAPVMLLVALAIKISSPGPIVYRQKRVGLNGKSFHILKFRSMRSDIEASARPIWATAQDHRITPIGRFIRSTRVDELPQLICVLRGDMSMVGPRPERPAFTEQLRHMIPTYDVRHTVRPGVTGWAQVKYSYGASVDDAVRKHEYDLYYIKHQSLWLDLKILHRTVTLVLFGEGAR